jgi:TRAP transporter TAXI family solute receptor
MNFKMPSRTVLGAAITVVLIGVIYFLSHTKPAWTVTIETGTPDLTFHALGEQLHWSLSELHGTPIQKVHLEETDGSAENLSVLLDAADNDYTLAFVSEAILRERLDADPSIAEEVRVVATLYQDLLQVVVRTNINSLKELEGKKVFHGGNGSSTESIVTNILSALAIDYQRTHEELGADAAFYMAGAPADGVAGALSHGSHKLLNLADEIEQMEMASGLKLQTIPPFTYREQGQEVRTIQHDVYLLARASLPEDLARLIVQATTDQPTQHLRETRGQKHLCVGRSS